MCESKYIAWPSITERGPSELVMAANLTHKHTASWRMEVSKLVVEDAARVDRVRRCESAMARTGGTVTALNCVH